MPNAPADVVKALQYNFLKIVNSYLLRKSGILLGFFLLCGQLCFSQQYRYQLRKGMDIGLSVGTTSLFATSLLLQQKVEPLSIQTINSLNRSNINAFDRIATFQWNRNVAKVSDGLAIGAIAMQAYFYFNKSTRTESINIGMVAFESFMLSQSIANTFKLTLRNRPYLYNTNVSMNEKLKADSRMSFFSAHTATVSSMCFSFAFAHQTYLPNSQSNKLIWVSAFTIPALQGYLRVKAGKHYPSDVITGYLIGLGSSYLMHKIHLRK